MPKRRVIFTIDPDVYENAQNFVGYISGLSVSSLFELLLGQFIQKMAPVLNAALSGDVVAQIEAFRRFYGESHADLALEFADVIRMIQEKEAKLLAIK